MYSILCCDFLLNLSTSNSHNSTPHYNALKNTSVANGNLMEDLLYSSDFYSLNGHGPRRSYSSSPESAAGQVLTLADLSPAGSEPNLPPKGRVLSTPLISSSQPLRSSYPDLRNGSTHLSPRDQEVCRPHTYHRSHLYALFLFQF